MSNETTFKKGNVVDWEGQACRVLRRRRVTGLAMFQTSEFEIKLVSVDGDDVGWVGENEVTRLKGDPRIAAKAQVVAEGIVDAFLTVVDGLGVYYSEHPDHRAELVEAIAEVIERAFGGRSPTEEA